VPITESTPDRHLPLPPHAAGEHEARQIHARDQENDPDDPEQEIQEPRRLRVHGLSAFGPLEQTQRGEVAVAPDQGRRHRAHRRGQALLNDCLGGLRRNASHHTQPEQVVRSEAGSVGPELAVDTRLRGHREGDLRLREEPTHGKALEAIRAHANDLGGDAVQANRAADDGTVAAEGAHPESVAEDGHQGCLGRVIVRDDGAPERHRYLQGREVVSVDQRAPAGEGGLALHGDADAVEEGESADADVRWSGLAQSPVDRIAEVAAQGGTGVRVAVRGLTDGVDAVVAFTAPREELQLLRALDRERREQERAHDAEHRRVRADADREGEHRDQRETGAATQHAEDIAQLLA
jgi:hypothetical protein